MRAALFALLAACSAKFGFPPDSHISCASDAECPPGSSCKGTVGACVSNDNPDTTPPAAVGTLSRSVAKPGDELLLRVVANEELSGPAIVTLETPTAVLLENLGGGIYQYISTGDEPEAVPIALSALLTDRAGNQSSATLATVTFDRTPPVLDNFDWRIAEATKTAAKQDDVLAIAGDSEANIGVSQALLLSDSGLVLADVTAQMRLVLSIGVSSRIEGDIDLSAIDLGGVVGIAIELVLADAVGNVRAPELARSSLFAVDLSPPTAPAIALAAGALDTIDAQVSALLSAEGASEVFIAGDVIETVDTFKWRPFASPQTTPIVLTFKPQAKVVTARFRDGAFNETGVVEDGIILSPDFTPPSIDLFTLTAPNPTNDRNVAFTLHVRDNLAPELYVITESSTTPLLPEINRAAGSGMINDTTLIGTAQGVHTLYPWVLDVSGIVNVGDLGDARTITLDTVAPVVSAASILSGAAYTKSNTLTTAYATSDATTSVVGCVASLGATAPDPAMITGSCSAKNVTADAADGAQTVYVWAKDAAGNVNAAGIGTNDTIFVDRVNPTLTLISDCEYFADTDPCPVSLTDGDPGGAAASGVGSWFINATTGAEPNPTPPFALSAQPTQVTLGGNGFFSVTARIADRALNTALAGFNTRRGDFPVDSQSATPATGNQARVRVAGNTGGYIAVWEDPTSSGAIALQIFGNGTQTFAAPTLVVNSAAVEDSPDVAATNGPFWISYRSGTVARARRHAAGGTLLDDFAVSSTMTGAQSDPAISNFFSNRVIVVWTEGGRDGDGTGVFGRSFDFNGTPNAIDFAVNTTTAEDQGRADIAPSSGSFLAVWESGATSDIYARVINSAGVPQGSDFRVNVTTAGAQTRPRVAPRPAGGWVVAWESADASGLGIFARALDATGTPLGASDTQVNTTATNDQTAPSIATQNSVMVAWHSADQGETGATNVFYRTFDGTLTATSAEKAITSSTSGNQRDVEIAPDNVGTVFMWRSDHAESAGVYSLFAHGFRTP